MTGRQKIEAAFSAGGTSQFAAVIPYEGIYIRDRWSELTGLPWWAVYDMDLDRELKWRSTVIERLGQDWVTLHAGPSPEARSTTCVEERLDGVYLVDTRTNTSEKLQPRPVGGWNAEGRIWSRYWEHPAETFAEIDRLLPPQTPEDPEQIGSGGRDEITQAMLNRFGGSISPTWQVASPFWGCYGLWGYENLMVFAITKPELVRHACERYLERSIGSLREAASLGIDIVWIEECLTDQVRPEVFRDLNVPFVRRIVEETRALGMKSVYYFCGDPAGKWEHILDVGADALSLEESKKSFRIDIEEVVDMVRGRCALLGNLDAVGVLQDGSEETLRCEVARQLEAGRRNRGRFIMSLGSPVTPDTPVSRVRRYCDTVRELS